MNQTLKLANLVDGVHLLLDDCGRDDVVDVGNGLQHALSVPFGLVLVAKLQGFVNTWTRTVKLNFSEVL